MSDERTPAEIASNYPPRKSSMVRACTAPIIGAPHEWLFDEVTTELLACLNAPGLTRESLFTTFRDTAGAFVAPSMHQAISTSLASPSMHSSRPVGRSS